MFNIVDKNNNIVDSFESVYEAWNVSRIMIAVGNEVSIKREDGTEVNYEDIYVTDDVDDDFYEDCGMW